MFNVASGKLFSLTENTRAETLSWHTYIRYLNKSKKKEQQIILLFELLSLFYHYNIIISLLLLLLYHYYNFIFNLRSYRLHKKTLKKVAF